MISRILERLYVGDSGFTPEDLQRLGVNNVLNVGGVELKPTCQYAQIHLVDNGHNPPHAFKTALATLDDAAQRGMTTLVCCRRGVSRSVFLVMLWLERMGMSRDEAYAYVKERHPVAQVNVELMESYP